MKADISEFSSHRWHKNLERHFLTEGEYRGDVELIRVLYLSDGVEENPYLTKNLVGVLESKIDSSHEDIEFLFFIKNKLFKGISFSTQQIEKTKLYSDLINQVEQLIQYKLENMRVYTDRINHLKNSEFSNNQKRGMYTQIIISTIALSVATVALILAF